MTHIANDPSLCCLPGAWDRATVADIRAYGEPLPPEVADTAAETGVDPHQLDWHVTAEHGREPHDQGYADAVKAAVKCVKNEGVCP